jgi:hypothetical protein
MAMERTREFNKPLFICFIDNKTGNDSVNRELLWGVCLRYAISEKLVSLLKILYKHSTGRVNINSKVLVSYNFEIKALVCKEASLRQFYSIFCSILLLEKAFSAIPCGIKNVKHDETVGICITLIFSKFSSNSNL